MLASMANPPFAFPASWKGIKRVLIEYCTYDDSALCKDTEYSKGCYNIRCTQKDDMTLESSLRSLLAFIRCVPRNIVVTLWSGIPCTGGSPAQNGNIHRPNHAKRMAAHYKLWNELFDNYVIAAQAVVQRGGHLVLEWPSRCRYWKQPKVKALLGITELGWKDMRVKACAHGQRILTGKDKGKALTKVWRLVSTINDLQSAMDIPCQGDHDHVTTIGGSRALLSGKYPDGFAKAFHQHYRNVVLNNDKFYTQCVIDLRTTSP